MIAIVGRGVEDLVGVNQHRQPTMTKTGRVSSKPTGFIERDGIAEIDKSLQWGKS